jgi:hypothetical protein
VLTVYACVRAVWCGVVCAVCAVEFYFYYSLALLAECRSARRLTAPRQRVNELSSTWRNAEKNIGIKNSELRRRRDSLRRRNRQRTKAAAREDEGSCSSDEESQSDELTQEEYDEHLATVANNQKMLKCWVDSAPANFAHWYKLVEVQFPSLIFVRAIS